MNDASSMAGLQTWAFSASCAMPYFTGIYTGQVLAYNQTGRHELHNLPVPRLHNRLTTAWHKDAYKAAMYALS